MTVCCYYVTYEFQGESVHFSCLNAKELLARKRRDIWSLSDSNGRHGVVNITTAQHHSTKSELRFCAVSIPARSMSEICDSEDLWQWSQQEIRLYLFCWSTIPQKNHHHHHYHRHHYSTQQILSFYINTQLFSQTGKITELCCESLSLQWVWLYVIILSRMSFESRCCHLNFRYRARFEQKVP